MAVNRIIRISQEDKKTKISTSNEDTSLSDLNQYWTNEQALQLIQFYKEYINSNKMTDRWKKVMWEHIAAQMRDAGYASCTASHCSTKYKCMSRQYRIVTENNVIPGNKKRSCFFYKALSEVYSYVPVISQPSESKSNGDDNDDPCGSSSTSKTVMSLILDMNDDDGEQEQKCFDKMETMHQEKMEMFSAFLRTVPLSDNGYRRTSQKTLQKQSRKREMFEDSKVISLSDSEDNADEVQESGQSDGFDVSGTLAIDPDPNKSQWTEPWSKETSDVFMSLLEKYRSMWIDPACKKETFWELVASELNKETGTSFESQEVEKHFKVLAGKYRKVIYNNSKPGAKLITCFYFKQLNDLFSSNPNGWYRMPKVFVHSQPRFKRKCSSSGNELLTLLKTIHSERKDEEQRMLKELKRMHDDKMTFFSSLLNVLKKTKK
ncbi:uncharacterized protein LOC121383245 isoform X2 [Gigantopelta aegis]|uniref:uncharacterized protein LOC121383245 isoform X2 n=1 Tax=Gigantopelta aegis TaxID=1735272 RepID=UPI001B887646|nr:uncharacterized protein LOC121383245 isoform X2 [Gigantopelta aegis]